jgi:mono/diheme cytochrome c family protein
MNKKTTAIALTLAVMAAGLGAIYLQNRSGEAAFQVIPPIDPGDAVALASGKQLYAQACASCHGANLEGQADWRQRKADGRLPAPPHDPSGHTWHHPDAMLFAVTKYGPEVLAKGDYKSDMPGFEGTLTDSEIVAVLAYIKSTWPSEIRARQAEMDRRARAQAVSSR